MISVYLLLDFPPRSLSSSPSFLSLPLKSSPLLSFPLKFSPLLLHKIGTASGAFFCANALTN